jgi:hypothetical protein
MFFISDLHNIKNLLPIIYTSHDFNSVAKLIMLHSKIKQKYKNINFFFVLNDLVHSKFSYEFTMNQSTYVKYKNNFAKQYILETDIKNDMILKFSEDNEIDLFTKKSNPNFDGIYCRNSEDKNILLNKFKCNILQISNLSDIQINNYAICDAESPDLLVLAEEGRQIISLKKYNLSNSFQKMFPDTIVL